MRGDTNMKPRGSVFYFRRRVPADIGTYEGKKEIRYSLDTKDKLEAKRRAREEYLKWEEKFDALRAGRTITELTDEQMQSLSANWVADILAEDEKCRIDGRMRPSIIDESTRVMQDLEAGYRMCLAHGEFMLVEARVDDVLHKAGIKLARQEER